MKIFVPALLLSVVSSMAQAAEPTQAFLKLPIDVEADCIDLLTLNAHKAHGPKGVGALYVHGEIELTPLAHGGGHEMGRRSGHRRRGLARRAFEAVAGGRVPSRCRGSGVLGS